MFYQIACPLSDKKKKNVYMNILAFNIEKEIYCNLEEKPVGNIDLFLWQYICF
jgi:hypothetical protein